MRSHCLAILPNMGLGNILFPWAYSEVFGALNGIPACAIGWGRPHVGPLLRGERRMRFYGNSFIQSKSALLGSAFVGMMGTVIWNSTLARVEHQYKSNHLFIWNQMPDWRDYFGPLREHRDLLRNLI